MRMDDMRVCDNRALAQASAMAVESCIPLLVFFILSPQDYSLHDTSSRRIDFALRNLFILKDSLSKLNIPLHVSTQTSRRTLPAYVISLLQSVNATQVFANIEYEVDELQRDLTVSKLAHENGILPTFLHDKLVVEPGLLSTKQGKPYSVYSPFQRQWLSTINNDISKYLAEAPPRLHPVFGKLFGSEIPCQVDGYTCSDKDKMAVVWPAGIDAAREMLRRFLRTKSRKTHLGPADPLEEGEDISKTHSRVMVYKENRDQNAYVPPWLLSTKKLQTNRDSGVGMWVQEIAWRDFYGHVLAAFPRVSMGRPFREKYAGVQWETNHEHLEAWRAGRTGVPIVDAAMRQANSMGWMHNRARMIAAMYLTKDLMIDWRLGEKHFMQQFIDGDLASNNGGWQWSASTGTDPQPYFRVFNPYSQSEKVDPSGDYIRTFVPELSKVFGPDIHNPPAKLAEKLGYPRPLVDHKEARVRALRRYKNPGLK
ncbi:DNA photolyase, FAD-binding/Cryptochrome [Lactifluus volemus]|nr:DNA photolyase, FAD-binding/Cryptochrome [Lactifluus volemus]